MHPNRFPTLASHSSNFKHEDHRRDIGSIRHCLKTRIFKNFCSNFQSNSIYFLWNWITPFQKNKKCYLKRITAFDRGAVWKRLTNGATFMVSRRLFLQQVCLLAVCLAGSPNEAIIAPALPMTKYFR
jgi:hypothetical protein